MVDRIQLGLRWTLQKVGTRWILYPAKKSGLKIYLPASDAEFLDLDGILRAINRAREALLQRIQEWEEQFLEE
jgi:hypothetical protein